MTNPSSQPAVHMQLTRSGAGEPPLVFVHGFGCSRTDWHRQVDYFSQRHAVLACDLRGHGQTPGAADDCSIPTYGADVAQLLLQRDLGNAVLVGHSMGCRVVLQAALDAPSRVGAVVLIDSSQLASGDAVAAEAVACASIERAGYAGFSRDFFDGMFVASSPPELKRAICARAADLPASIGTRLFPRMVAWDAQHMEAALATLRVPLLVIQSTYLNADRVRVSLEPGVDTPWLQTVRGCVPDARIEVVCGVGHFPQVEAPERINGLIESFISPH